MERWCLCKRCVDAHASHGEKFFTRKMTWEDCTDEENEMDMVFCEFCEEEYPIDDMYMCK